jgi:ankyrin repeat protein
MAIYPPRLTIPSGSSVEGCQNRRLELETSSRNFAELTLIVGETSDEVIEWLCGFIRELKIEKLTLILIPLDNQKMERIGVARAENHFLKDFVPVIIQSESAPTLLSTSSLNNSSVLPHQLNQQNLNGVVPNNNQTESPFLRLLRNILFKAIKRGDTPLVTELLKNGVSANTKNRYGSSALHIAAYFGYVEVAKVLLKFGARINAKNNFNNTPLHEACESGEFDMVKLLVHRGASIHIRDSEGYKPRDEALRNGFTDIAKYLRLKEVTSRLH